MIEFHIYLHTGDFNPYNVYHGAPEFKSRHLGDLGNIEANSTGIAVFRFKDKQIKIQDKVRGIIGRSVVVSSTHSGPFGI